MQMDDQQQEYTNVFVKNIGEDVDDVKLMELCAQFGEIMSAKVMKDESGKPKGFGFISFETHDAALECVTTLNGSDRNGRTLYAGRAQKKAERTAELKARFEVLKQDCNTRCQGVNLYIKNLDDEIDDDRLRKEFSRFGNITSAKVMTDGALKSKGFGFVCFSSPEEAIKAVAEMNGRIIVSKALYVAPAQRKEERRKQLASQYEQRVAAEVRVGAGQVNPVYPAIPAQQNVFPAGQPTHIRHPCWGWQPQQYGQPNFQAMPGAAGHQYGAPRTGTATAQFRPPMPATRVPVQVNPGGQRVRGMVVPAQQQMHMERGAQPAAISRGKPVPLEPLTPDAQHQELKQRIGECLYFILHETHKELAGKITGMLLEFENSELICMLESRDILEKKVEEVIQVMITEQDTVRLDRQRGTATPPQEQMYTGAEAQLGTFNHAKPVPLEPLTPAVVSSTQPQELNRMIGERLYFILHETHKELAGKITGMLLELENSKLLHMLESRESLEKKVEEAVEVLIANHHQNCNKL